MDKLRVSPAPLETKRYKFEGAPAELARRLRIDDDLAGRFRLATTQWSQRGAMVFLFFITYGFAAGTGLMPNMWSFWALIGSLAGGLGCALMIQVYRDRGGVSSRKLHAAIALLEAAAASKIAAVVLHLDLAEPSPSPALEGARWIKRRAQTWLTLEFSRGETAWRLAARRRLIQPVSVDSFPALVPDGPDEGGELVFVEAAPSPRADLGPAPQGVFRVSRRGGRLRALAKGASPSALLRWAASI